MTSSFPHKVRSSSLFALVLVTVGLSTLVLGQAGGGQASSPPPAQQGRGQAGAGQGPAVDPAAVARAEGVLAEARKALGGEKLAAIKTILVTGRTNRVRGNNLVPIEFEIAIELPDKYVRKDEIPAEESEPTSAGFAGTELIQLPLPAPVPARAGAPPPAPGQIEAQTRNRIQLIKQDFVRLTLGMFAGSFPSAPVTFSFAGTAEAPQGTADVLNVRGEGNFAARLFIQRDTHLPVMIGWQAPPSGVVIAVPNVPLTQSVAPGVVVITGPVPPAASASQEEKDKYNREVGDLRKKTLATPVEHRLYYADYQDVNGVKFPFRLRRAIGPDTSEETRFDRFRLNVTIDPRKFANK